MLLVFVLALKILFTEPRVFCEDKNALSWNPLGPTCPITCNTIKTAVDKLKIRDYQYLINNKDETQVNMSLSDLYFLIKDLQDNIYNRRTNSLQPHIRKHIQLYQTYHRLLSNDNFEYGLKVTVGKMTIELHKKCSKMAKKNVHKKTINIKCTRKMLDSKETLEKFTKFLNVFADPMYLFNKEMAGIILRQLHGTVDLRFGRVNHKIILSYLRTVMKYHQSQTTGNRTIYLQSRNCLTIYLPGCFCKNGFVENQGICVKPEDCPASSMNARYLERIVLY